MSKTLYIIDGHAQMYRAYHAGAHGRRLTSPDGEPTWATLYFFNMLLAMLDKKQPDYVLMAVDGPRKELLRSEWYPEYKAQRKPTPEEFFPQEKRILELVKAVDLPVLHTKGYEADDMIATVAKRLASDELHVVIVSGDKDLAQLITPNVSLFDPNKDIVFTPETLLAEKGFRPDQVIEIQTLTGDSIDNIPGIPGVGPKTAIKLINKYGTAEAVLAAADEQTPKLRENLIAGGTESLALARKLVTLDNDVPVKLDLDAGDIARMNLPAAADTFSELGMGRLVERIARISGADIEVSEEFKVTTAADFDYNLITTTEQLDAMLVEFDDCERFAFDTETTGLKPLLDTLCGISLCCKPGRAFYIPIATSGGGSMFALSDRLDLDTVRAKLTPLLSKPDVEKIGHNVKFDLLFLRNANFDVAGPFFDTMIAAHVLDSSRPSFKLDNLSNEILRHQCIPIFELIGRGKKQITFDQVPLDVAAPYAGEDADVTLRLADTFREELTTTGLDTLFRELEMPLMEILADMETRGITVDAQCLKTMEVTLTKQADDLAAQIHTAAGNDTFNLDSTKQLGEILFGEEHLNLPILKKGKTGPSTDSSTMELLAMETDSPLPDLILEYRKLKKLISTYLSALVKEIHPRTGRIHTSFNQTMVATGRLSSSNPNLQNIPIRTEQGRLIRSAFVPAEGCVLLSADYSQVELRMLAHFCEDPTLIEAFENDLDIHTIVASEVFSVPLDEVTSDQRGRAKTVNFGIIYGQTAFGLSNTLRIPRHEAQEFIDRYRARFPQIDDFLATCIDEAKAKGYVETISQRRRYIPDIKNPRPMVRQAAERLAINSVVQGSAADLIKLAMLRVDAKLRETNSPASMRLQIHDELVFELPQSEVAAASELINAEMTGALDLRVPLKVDIHTGENWMAAK